jgi:hypothetical protein
MKEHYIHGRPPDLEEVEWEYKEIDRMTGRERRKRFKVPFYFEEGTIVCYEGRGQASDSIFEGEPTNLMEPLDEEAKRISAEYEHKWVHPIESLPGQGLEAALITSFEKQMERLAKIPAPVPVAESGVSREEFDQLRGQLAQLMARNAELEAKPKAAPRAGVGNRRTA